MFKTSSSVRALLGVLACPGLLELLKHRVSSTSLQLVRQSTGQSPPIHRARYKKIFQIHVGSLKRNASGDGRLLLLQKMEMSELYLGAHTCKRFQYRTGESK